MRANETPSQALQRLLGELAAHRRVRGREYAEHHRKVQGDVNSLLREVPLIHGQNKFESFRDALAARCLQPRQALAMRQLEAETYLGLGDVVYTAAGVLYPEKRFAFVLAPRIEEDRKVEASPWDSGSFYRSLCPHLPAAKDGSERREVFLAHTLPAPQYREYLVHYVATMFSSGQDYLNSEMPCVPDPLGAISDKFTSRIFEVRLAGSVPLETWSIEKVFAPKDGGDRESLVLRRLLEPLARKDRVLWYKGASSDLKHEVRRWLVQRAARRGVHAR